jgi:hypothetical protein
MANLDTSLAATKTEASTNVVVVTTNTASPREWSPPKSAISIRSIVAIEERCYVMAVVESKYPYLLFCAGVDPPSVQCSTHSFANRALTRALLTPRVRPARRPEQSTVAVRNVGFEGYRVVPVSRCRLEESFRRRLELK